MNSYYRFLKGFYGPADILTTFQEKIDRTLGHQTQLWLDNIIIVTRGTKEEHTRELYSLLETRKRRIQSKKEKNQNFTKKKQYGSDTQYHKTASDQTRKKQTLSINLTPHKHQNIKILSRCHTVFRKVHTQPLRKNRQHEKTTQERNKMA